MPLLLGLYQMLFAKTAYKVAYLAVALVTYFTVLGTVEFAYTAQELIPEHYANRPLVDDARNKTWLVAHAAASVYADGLRHIWGPRDAWTDSLRAARVLLTDSFPALTTVNSTDAVVETLSPPRHPPPQNSTCWCNATGEHPNKNLTAVEEQCKKYCDDINGTARNENTYKAFFEDMHARANRRFTGKWTWATAPSWLWSFTTWIASSGWLWPRAVFMGGMLAQAVLDVLYALLASAVVFFVSVWIFVELAVAAFAVLRAVFIQSAHDASTHLGFADAVAHNKILPTFVLDLLLLLASAVLRMLTVALAYRHHVFNGAASLLNAGFIVLATAWFLLSSFVEFFFCEMWVDAFFYFAVWWEDKERAERNIVAYRGGAPGAGGAPLTMGEQMAIRNLERLKNDCFAAQQQRPLSVDQCNQAQVTVENMHGVYMQERHRGWFRSRTEVVVGVQTAAGVEEFLVVKAQYSGPKAGNKVDIEGAQNTVMLVNAKGLHGVAPPKDAMLQICWRAINGTDYITPCIEIPIWMLAMLTIEFGRVKRHSEYQWPANIRQRRDQDGDSAAVAALVGGAAPAASTPSPAGSSQKQQKKQKPDGTSTALVPYVSPAADGAAPAVPVPAPTAVPATGPALAQVRAHNADAVQPEPSSKAAPIVRRVVPWAVAILASLVLVKLKMSQQEKMIGGAGQPAGLPQRPVTDFVEISGNGDVVGWKRMPAYERLECWCGTAALMLHKQASIVVKHVQEPSEWLTLFSDAKWVAHHGASWLAARATDLHSDFKRGEPNCAFELTNEFLNHAFVDKAEQVSANTLMMVLRSDDVVRRQITPASLIEKGAAEGWTAVGGGCFFPSGGASTRASSQVSHWGALSIEYRDGKQIFTDLDVGRREMGTEPDDSVHCVAFVKTPLLGGATPVLAQEMANARNETAKVKAAMTCKGCQKHVSALSYEARRWSLSCCACGGRFFGACCGFKNADEAGYILANQSGNWKCRDCDHCDGCGKLQKEHPVQERKIQAMCAVCHKRRFGRCTGAAPRGGGRDVLGDAWVCKNCTAPAPPKRVPKQPVAATTTATTTTTTTPAQTRAAVANTSSAATPAARTSKAATAPASAVPAKVPVAIPLPRSRAAAAQKRPAPAAPARGDNNTAPAPAPPTPTPTTTAAPTAPAPAATTTAAPSVPAPAATPTPATRAAAAVPFQRNAVTGLWDARDGVRLPTYMETMQNTCIVPRDAPYDWTAVGPMSRHMPALNVAALQGSWFTALRLVRDVNHTNGREAARLALALSTRKLHLDALHGLREFILKDASRGQLPLTQVAIDYLQYKARSGRTPWQPQTMQRQLANLYGAMQSLWLYSDSTVGVALDMRLFGSSNEWSQFAKHISLEAAQNQPTGQTAVTTDTIVAVLDMEDSITVRMALLLMWHTAARIGDALQLRRRSVRLNATTGQLDITFEHGKGVLMRGGKYTVHTVVHNARLCQELLQHLSTLDPNDLVATPTVECPSAARAARCNKALKRVDPALSTRSIRRGALQAMATGDPPVPLETLMAYAGHKNETTTKRYLDWGLLFGQGQLNENTAAAHLALPDGRPEPSGTPALRH